MSKNKFFIVGAFSVVALVIGACSGSDDDESDSTSDALVTTAMVPAIQAIVDLAAATPDSSVDLTACPLGDFFAMLDKAPAGVQAIAAASEGELRTYVYQTDIAGEPAFLQCARGDVGAYTGEVPEGDYRQNLVQELEIFDVTFDDDSAYRGGTIVRFCTEAIGVGGGEFCEADWYDSNVWVGVFIDGESRSSDLAEQWLIAILDDVVANVPQLAPSIQPAD